MLRRFKERFQGRAGKAQTAAGRAGNPGQAEGYPQPRENRKILVVGQGDSFKEAEMDYALNLAERLGYDLIALNVGPGPATAATFLTPYRKYQRDEFSRRAREAARVFKDRVTAQGLNFIHLVKFGDLGPSIEQINHEIKRVELVITATDITDAEVMAEVNLPFFTLKGFSEEKITTGGREMRQMRPWGKTIAWGIGTAALYAATFLNSGTVMKYFTRGGWYAALPIMTVFAFSFVHGAFAHHLWSALGIEATKKVVQPRPEAKRPVRRQRPRPELRLNA
ncbi:MAG: universal stress protein [Thermodesulfobacteriota bacterium]